MFYPVSVLLPHLDRKASCNLKLISYAWQCFSNCCLAKYAGVFFLDFVCLVALASELMSCTVFVMGDRFCLIARAAIYEFTRSQNAL